MKADAYRLATASDVTELEALVNALLDEGWELYGEPICQTTVQRTADGGRSGGERIPSGVDPQAE